MPPMSAGAGGGGDGGVQPAALSPMAEDQPGHPDESEAAAAVAAPTTAPPFPGSTIPEAPTDNPFLQPVVTPQPYGFDPTVPDAPPAGDMPSREDPSQLPYGLPGPADAPYVPPAPAPAPYVAPAPAPYIAAPAPAPAARPAYTPAPARPRTPVPKATGSRRAGAKGKAMEGNMADAMEYCRYAIRALEHKKVDEAVERLQEALRQLT